MSPLISDLFQWQCPDPNPDADHRGRHSRAGADPGRGRGDAGWVLHPGNARQQGSMPSSPDRSLSWPVCSIWGEPSSRPSQSNNRSLNASWTHPCRRMVNMATCSHMLCDRSASYALGYTDSETPRRQVQKSLPPKDMWSPIHLIISSCYQQTRSVHSGKEDVHFILPKCGSYLSPRLEGAFHFSPLLSFIHACSSLEISFPPFFIISNCMTQSSIFTNLNRLFSLIYIIGMFGLT